jgi:hypothetical protein
MSSIMLYKGSLGQLRRSGLWGKYAVLLTLLSFAPQEEVLLFYPFEFILNRKDKKMKTTNRTLSLLLAILMIFSLTACFKHKVDVTGLWEQATYTEDTTLGNGKTTVEVEFVIEDQSITITLKTDKETLGEALFEHSLVNDPSFFDTANGIKADYSANQAWWKVCKGGEITSVGVSDLVIADGDHYEFIYTVGF